MEFIDNLLNRITMYRLMLYYLLALLGVAAIFGALGILPYSPLAILLSAAIILAVCWAMNSFFAWSFNVPANAESFYITAFILALIITPISLKPFNAASFWFLVLASVFAMTSKYIVAINKKHIFNPAAFAVAATALTFNQYASWWVGGNLPLLAFVLIGGLLIARKIQRFDLVLTFFVTAIVSIIATNASFNPFTTAEKAIIHTTILFFGFVMLTEPLTTPPTRSLRITYGALVGLLFSPAVHIGPIYSTPELALIAGNIFSWLVSPKSKYSLTLISKTEVGKNIYDFAFIMPQKINFSPGQYMEFTLPPDGADLRGNRRYFTIASSPTEPDLRLGVKFYGDDEKSIRRSMFKKKMLLLKSGETIMAGQRAGDFTLPKDASRKLVFIAGGIGITPFRSMIKYLSDGATNQTGGNHPDIVLLYANKTKAEVAYREIFDEAARTIGLKTIYITSEENLRIDATLIQHEIHDWRERIFYISGPHEMVEAFRKTLRSLGVSRANIKTDFFPGF
jgi:ferredoxin-NADP reductase